MMGILSEALQRQAVSNAIAQARMENARQAAIRVVEKLHASVSSYLGEVMSLDLLGDYKQSVPLRDRNKLGVMRKDGLAINLGSKIAHSALVLVVRMENGTLMDVQLRIERSYPYKSETVEQFDVDTPAEVMLKAFFAALAPYVAIDANRM